MNAENMLDRLLKQLEQRGLRIVPDGAGGLAVRGPQSEVTPGVLDALKAFKPQLLKRFVSPDSTPEPEPTPKVEEAVECLDLCRVCGRDVSDPEDRDRLKDPLYCQFFGGRAVTVGGELLHPEEPRCPFKAPR